MIDKRIQNIADALDGVRDGATVLCSGFGSVGEPVELMNALTLRGVRDLTVVANNAGTGETGLAALIKAGAVRKIVCSFPRTTDPHVFEALYKAGQIELEIVPQGTLSERMRAGGAGIAGFYTKVSVGTKLAAGKEVREFNGVPHVLELPIRGDLALIKAHTGDRWGNLIYRKSARNFNPVMAMAGEITVAQVSHIAELGTLDPDNIHTPGIFVDRLVLA